MHAHTQVRRVELLTWLAWRGGVEYRTRPLNNIIRSIEAAYVVLLWIFSWVLGSKLDRLLLVVAPICLGRRCIGRSIVGAAQEGNRPSGSRPLSFFLVESTRWGTTLTVPGHFPPKNGPIEILPALDAGAMPLCALDRTNDVPPRSNPDPPSLCIDEIDQIQSKHGDSGRTLPVEIPSINPLRSPPSTLISRG